MFFIIYLSLLILAIKFKEEIVMGKFFKGALFGAAAALLGNYLLNTKEGKEKCQKLKDEVEKLKNDLKEKFNENNGCAETVGKKDADCCTDVCENRSSESDTEIKSDNEESKEGLI